MRFARIFALFVVAVLITASLPSQAALASSQPVPRTFSSPAQTAGCTNADFLTAVGKDLTDFGTSMGKLDTKDPIASAKFLISVAALRQKYEDMKADDKCVGAYIAMIAGLANYEDLVGLVLAIKADPDNAKTYGDAAATQAQRGAAYMKLITDSLTGKSNMDTSSITVGECKDKDYQTTVGKDLVDFGDSLKKLDTTDAAAVAKLFVATFTLRQKYEDMKNVPGTCFIANLATVVAFANYGDMLALVMASKADADNAKTYNDALAPQVQRAQKFLGVALQDMGIASTDTAATPAK